MTIPAGTCPGVGIAGLTLGGGIGFLSRQYGLTCDNLAAVELVDADGGCYVPARSHPDLFWALRGGGGGNFGIATTFTFRVHPIDDVVTCTVTWPWDDAAEVLDAWQRWAPFVDERLCVTLAIAHPSAGTISATGLFTGSAVELPSLLEPLLRAGTRVRRRSNPCRSSRPPSSLPDHRSRAWISRTRRRSPTIRSPPQGSRPWWSICAPPLRLELVGFFPLAGAIATIDPAATAFVHRRALFDLQYQAYWWDDAAAPASIAWVRDLRAAMAPYTTGAYVNYVDADLLDWESAYYGTNRGSRRSRPSTIRTASSTRHKASRPVSAKAAFTAGEWLSSSDKSASEQDHRRSSGLNSRGGYGGGGVQWTRIQAEASPASAAATADASATASSGPICVPASQAMANGA